MCKSIKKLLSRTMSFISKFQTKINEFLHNNWDRIISLIGIIGISWALYESRFLLSYPSEVLGRNLGKSEFVSYIGSAIVLLLIGIAICMLIFFFYKFLNKKPNWWIWGTIIGMVYIIYIGFYFIDNELGNKSLTLVLRDDLNNSEIIGGINCSSETIPITGERITCDYLPKLNNMKGIVKFTFKNNSQNEYNFDDLSFTAPSEIKHFSFHLEGYNNENVKRIFSVGYDYTFLTKEEYRQNRKEFVTYILVLLGIVLFSIPSLAVNFKILSERIKEEKDKKQEKK